MLKRIGEPYLSRRRNADETQGTNQVANQAGNQGEHAGLGLGVFIARTLLERTGAKVSFTNRVFPITAPWFRSPGRAAVSKQAKSPPNQHPRAFLARHRLYAALAAPRCRAICWTSDQRISDP